MTSIVYDPPVGWHPDDLRALGAHKPLGYLPIRTVLRFGAPSLEAYTASLDQAGIRSVVLGPDQCCIASGAVYACSPEHLQGVLTRSAPLLAQQGWSTDIDDFVRRVAAEWLPDGSPLMPVIRAAFGDASSPMPGSATEAVR